MCFFFNPPAFTLSFSVLYVALRSYGTLFCVTVCSVLNTASVTVKAHLTWLDLNCLPHLPHHQGTQTNAWGRRRTLQAPSGSAWGCWETHNLGARGSSHTEGATLETLESVLVKLLIMWTVVALVPSPLHSLHTWFCWYNPPTANEMAFVFVFLLKTCHIGLASYQSPPLSLFTLLTMFILHYMLHYTVSTYLL